MTTLISSAARLLHDQKLAEELLAPHELLGESYWDSGRGARWCIGRPQRWDGTTEIIAGICGSLLVHGDYDTSRFAHYGDHGDAWSRLLWMADCTDVGYYVAQKASIGAGKDDVWGYDEAVARYDLARLIADYEESPGDYTELLPILKEAAAHYTESEHELRGFLSSEDKGWDLWEITIGKVLRWNVVIGHTAIKRCAALLRARHGASGPPECREAPP